jgi:hypothetical protein
VVQSLVCCTSYWLGVVVLVENKSLPRAPGRGGDKVVCCCGGSFRWWVAIGVCSGMEERLGSTRYAVLSNKLYTLGGIERLNTGLLSLQLTLRPPRRRPINLRK